MSFKKNGYKIVRKSIPQEIADIVCSYFLLKREGTKFLYKHNIFKEDKYFGEFYDLQAGENFCLYGDALMDTLLATLMPIVEKNTNLKLVPNYSYARIYEKDSLLTRHKDRPECEISVTLNLGGDVWPIFLDPTGENNVLEMKQDEIKKGDKAVIKKGAHKGVSFNLSPGDILIYRGDKLEHWRERFKGNICAQVFLHYNDFNGPYKDSLKFDGRPFLGLPKYI